MCFDTYFFLLFVWSFVCGCAASYHEQYRVPKTCTDEFESYVFGDKEYIVQNLPVTWENANILCQGQYNGSLALVDTRERAEFLAEALSESQLFIESIWVGARRTSADDPAGYRWSPEVELRRTAMDVYHDDVVNDHYPMWLNRTRVPVPEGGADCVALERVRHDRPVFVDLQCLLERPFVCERDLRRETRVIEQKVLRCRRGQYHIFGGRLNWHQAAAFCVLHKMSLANIGSMNCLKKLGMAMLKIRPSIENAWIGSRGSLGKWTWLDTGVSIFQLPTYSDVQASQWPPLRDRSEVKQSGCLQLDRHAAHPPVFMEARCERKMQFICYQGNPAVTSPPQIPSDDMYSYVLVRQKLYWQHAYDNCLKMNGILASPDSSEVLLQLLLVMGENKDKPVSHIWISGRLNITKDTSDVVTYTWYNPSNGKKIYDPVNYSESAIKPYMLPWLEEEFSLDNPCLNLDREGHLNGLVYGLPCDTPQYSICMIEKTKQAVTDNITDGYESVTI